MQNQQARTLESLSSDEYLTVNEVARRSKLPISTTRHHLNAFVREQVVVRKQVKQSGESFAFRGSRCVRRIYAYKAKRV